MGDNLTILGKNYTNVVGIKATQTNDGQLAYIRPTGTHNITQNGTENVAQYEYVDVDVQFIPNLEDRTVNYTPSVLAQSDTVTQTDPGYDGLGEVTVNIAAMPAGTEGTPTVQVSKSSGVATITPSVTNSAGYIAATDPIVGTPVQVTGAELAYGTYTISQSGETNVAGYEKASVPLRTPGNSSDSEYYTSSGARKWRYRPKTTIPLAGWVNNGTVTGSWVPFDAIPTGTTVTPSTSSQTIGGANTMLEGAITVEAMPSGSASTPATSITANPTISIDVDGLITAGVSASQSITPSVSAGYIASGTAGTVSVSGAATHQLTTRDSSDLTASGLSVTAPAGYYAQAATKAVSPSLQAKSKSYTPSETAQSETVTADQGYDGLSSVSVSVGAISSTYVGSGIDRLYNSDVGFEEDERLVYGNDGYYPSGFYYEVPAQSLPTSASSTSSGTTKATIGRSTSDQYINIPKGYNNAIANYKVSAVPNGSASPAAVISGTSASVDRDGTTLYLSKTISNTPQVTAGYVGSGTAGNSFVELAATDSNWTAANIKKNVSIFGVTGTYEGSSKNAQTAQSTSRSTSTSGTSVISLTCSKTGTYDVYWTTFRSSTSGTWGSRLYIGGTAYETMNTSGWNNHVQNRHVSNVSITANQAVAVYVQSRGSNYYGYVGTLTIIES